jgi:hypothetical protein
MPGDPEVPGGDSYATLSIDAGGKFKLAGNLADGTKITQSGVVSGFGDWALYIPLYKGLGSFQGDVIYLPGSTEDYTAPTVNWFKPEMPTAKFYREDFATETIGSGALYTPPARGTRVIEITNGVVSFLGGNLMAPFENSITLGADNKVINNSSNKLTLTITATTGLFKGSVTPPDATKAISFGGVIYQKTDAAYGFFLGTNQSGQVSIMAP